MDFFSVFLHIPSFSYRFTLKFSRHRCVHCRRAWRFTSVMRVGIWPETEEKNGFMDLVLICSMG